MSFDSETVSKLLIKKNTIMKKNFTFILGLLLLGSVGNVMARDVNITEGESIADYLAVAEDGDVFILADGEYGEASTTINITKAVTFKAQNEGKAIVNLTQFVVPADANLAHLTFDGIVAKNDAAENRYFLQVNTVTSLVTNLSLKNCVIDGYGRGVIRATTEGAIIDNLVIENCTFINNSIASAGYSQVNTQKSNMKTAQIRNTTFYNSKGAIFRYEGKTDLNFLLENCNIIKCGSAEGRNMVEVGSSVTAGSVFKIKNSIFTDSYDGTIGDKPITLKNKGDIENTLLEGFSTTFYKEATETNPVSGTVTSFDFENKTIVTDPATITGIGDLRWSLNGSTNSIIDNGTQKNIQSVKYYDLLGKEVNGDSKGLLIEKTTFEDNSVETNKVIR